MKIEIIKFKNFYALPKRAHYNDAGADVYLPEKICIPKNSTKAIPLGFGLKIPNGFMGAIYPRSSLAKKRIVCELPPIDSGYRGEIHAIVTNMSKNDVIFNEGARIGQLIVHPVIMAEYDYLFEEERNQGAFGSTGE